jgi:membrane protein DedA with SNARE-associated domain
MTQTVWTSRRALWAAGVGVAGFIIGTGAGPVGSGLGALWGGAIGYGFGSIFGQTLPTKWLVTYWGVTMALVGPFFGLLVGAAMQPYASLSQLTLAGVIGLLAGMLLGFFIGTMQLRRIRRRFQSTQSGSEV